MNDIHEFLQLGYLSTRNNTIEKKFNYNYKEELSNYSLEELLKYGRELLLKDISEMVGRATDIIVPISGGLDSRLILSSLAECKNVNEIKTYTYGSPGALDYELGKKIGNQLGTNHNNINLMEYNYKIDDLHNFEDSIKSPTIMFHNLPIEKLSISSNTVIASGFLGDAVSGKRAGLINRNVKEVKKEYFKSIMGRNSFNINNDELILNLIEKPNYHNPINFDEIEKIYLFEYNLKFIFNQVIGNLNEENIYTPFYNTEFMSFLLSLPKEYRKNQYFYKKLIFESFSNTLNDIPVKNFHGTKYGSKSYIKKYNRIKNTIKHRLSEKSININSPFTNYVDFSKKMKLDKHFKELILFLLESLQARNLGGYNEEVNRCINEITNNNIKNVYDYLLLCSLEIYISKGKIINNA